MTDSTPPQPTMRRIITRALSEPAAYDAGRAESDVVESVLASHEG